jgi:hypothetical protein
VQSKRWFFDKFFNDFSDCSLQPENMKSESLVIADQPKIPKSLNRLQVTLIQMLNIYDPELDGLDSRIKFVILIFPYALSKHPSEGSLNVLRVKPHKPLGYFS